MPKDRSKRLERVLAAALSLVLAVGLAPLPALGDEPVGGTDVPALPDVTQESASPEDPVPEAAEPTSPEVPAGEESEVGSGDGNEAQDEGGCGAASTAGGTDAAASGEAEGADSAGAAGAAAAISERVSARLGALQQARSRLRTAGAAEVVEVSDAAGLAAALAAASTNAEHPTRIKLTSDIASRLTFQLESGRYAVLDLNGCELSSNAWEVLYVRGEMTLEDGAGDGTVHSEVANGVCVYIVNGSTFTMKSGTVSYEGSNGSGVYMGGGTFTMEGGTVSYEGSNGGGVNMGGGTFTMEGGTVTSSGRYCVYVGSGSFTMKDGSVSCGGTNGSGVEFGSGSGSGSFTMEGGTVYGKVNGVKMLFSGGNFTMRGGEVSGVQGVSALGGSLTMEGGTVSGVTGVDLSAKASFTMLDGEISASQTGVSTTGLDFVMEGGKIVSSTGTGVHAGGPVTIRGGEVTGGNYGVHTVDGTVTMEGGSVGGGNCGVEVVMRGAFTLKDGAVAGKWGVSIYNAGTVTMEGGAVSGDIYGTKLSKGTFTLKGGAVSGADSGVHMDDKRAAFAMKGGTVGGETYGVQVSKGTVTMEGGAVTGGEAGAWLHKAGYDGVTGSFALSAGTVEGGETGVRLDGGTFALGGGAVEGGETGVRVEKAGDFSLSGGPELSAPVDVDLAKGALINVAGALELPEPVTVKLEVDPEQVGPVAVTNGLEGKGAPSDFRAAVEHQVIILSDDGTAKVVVGEPVYYHANDGTGASLVQAVTAGVPTALTANAFKRARHRFAGWNTVANPTPDDPGTAYSDGQEVTLHGGLELYAQWERARATLTFDLAGGELDGKTGSLVVEADEGDVIEIPAAPTREGYVFKYWKGSKYNPGDKYTVEGNHTFTAVWEKGSGPAPATCRVTFDANGHGVAPTAQTVETGKKAARPDDPSAEGWAFGGWCTDKAGESEYDFSQPVTSDLVLYARWSRDPSPKQPGKSGATAGTGDPLAPAAGVALALAAISALFLVYAVPASRRRRDKAFAGKRPKLR